MKVDWNNKKPCYDRFARKTAAFYSLKKESAAQPMFDSLLGLYKVFERYQVVVRDGGEARRLSNGGKFIK